MERLGRYVAASTPQAHRRQVLRRLLCGAEGSEVRMTVRGTDGAEREVHLRRTLPAASQIAEPRSGDVLRWLPGNIGYADLDRLQRSEVDGMFNMFAAAKAIVFDMRGYPAGTAWAIAPRLASPGCLHPPAARFERPRNSAPLTSDGGMHWQPGCDVFLQSFAAASGPRYSGLTVMLIDERTISQAEHTGLFLRAANGTVFVGSPTAGTNGDVTSLVLPGGIAVSFTGQAVLHPDGSRLQRVGLVPDVTAHPTIAGVRDGRDEVLVAAIVYIQSAVAGG
ncbi:MAG: S41 family peptidase [Alphaproteobacteria bacterium]